MSNSRPTLGRLPRTTASISHGTQYCFPGPPLTGFHKHRWSGCLTAHPLMLSMSHHLRCLLGLRFFEPTSVITFCLMSFFPFPGPAVAGARHRTTCHEEPTDCISVWSVLTFFFSSERPDYDHKREERNIGRGALLRLAECRFMMVSGEITRSE